MRNASEPTNPSERTVRATFEVPGAIYDAFCALAKQRDLTFSQEMRRFMREYVEQSA